MKSEEFYLKTCKYRKLLLSLQRCMGKEESDILYFLSFCIEQYKMYKGLSGSETMRLFDDYGITDYLANNYDVLHTQSAEWMMQDIDEIINSKNR